MDRRDNQVMQRFFITVANCVLLAGAIIAVPAVSGVRFWHWQISSISTAQNLMMAGLMAAAAGNAMAALFLLKGRPERKLCWQWAAIFVALLGVEYAFVRGWLDLHWLQRALLWLQKRF
jgi:hypothetical protein